ncbi:hypothetical protein ACEWY4_019356 [Coilia grayii]|uniref:CAP-Gly domain-containing protein n=1 Tax=Coilia grayii TaxID=363190 RepID=A0ABD1JCS4_9TELE
MRNLCGNDFLEVGMNEDDLNCVRQRWSEALTKRREYLQHQIHTLINKPQKSEEDVEREAGLVEQWVWLTEERNAVLVPAPGSGIPGAPAHWTPSPGMEVHTPVLFLDLNAEALTGPTVAGVNSILPKEHGSQFFYLPIIRHNTDEVSCVCSWDSSIHDSAHLNRVSAPAERIYLIVKATVHITHPAHMELVLRKRIAVNIYNKQSFTQSLKRRMSLKNTLHSCGVTYEIVSNVPKASEEAEERETLALMAARSEGVEPQDGETYMEKYTRAVLQLTHILSLERLRQAVMVKEAVAAKSRQIRKSLSSPNVQHSSCCKGELSGCEDEDFKCEGQQDLTDCVFQDPSMCPASTPTKNRENHGSAPDSPDWLASPFKGLPVQSQRLLQALLPVREQQGRGKESRPLLSQEDSEEEDCDAMVSPAQGEGPRGFQPYVEEDFANFEVYNASLEMGVCEAGVCESAVCEAGVCETAVCEAGVCEAGVCATGECLGYSMGLEGVCVRGERGRALVGVSVGVCERECVSRSPTASSCTSGYFSHSTSSATLSDAAQSDATTGDSSQSEATLGDTGQSHTTLTDVPPPSSNSSEQPCSEPAPTHEATPTYQHSPSPSMSQPLPVISPAPRDAPPPCQLSTSPEFSDFQRAGEGQGQDWPLPLTNGSTPTPGQEGGGPVEQLPDWMAPGEEGGGPVEQLPDWMAPGEEGGGPVEQLPDWMAPGELVWVGGHCGTVHYVGGVEFAAGIWVGVELELAVGKHNGTVQGRVYFRCEAGHGVFVQPAHLRRHAPTSAHTHTQPLLR